MIVAMRVDSCEETHYLLYVGLEKFDKMKDQKSLECPA